MKIEKIMEYDGKTWVAYGGMGIDKRRVELARGALPCPYKEGDEIKVVALDKPVKVASISIQPITSVDNKERSIARAVALKAAIDLFVSLNLKEITVDDVQHIEKVAGEFEQWLVRK